MMEQQNEQTPQDVAAFWWGEVDAADTARQPYETWWQENIDKYAPKASDNPKTFGENINTNRDFTLVEQKRAQLFFHCPEVSIKPSPLMEGQGDILLTHQHLVNEFLGADRVDALNMVDQVLFDLLCPAGFGWTKMGYESVTQTVETAVPIPDPMTGAPAVDPMTGAPMTVPQSVPVPISEKLFWERISPMAALVPAGWHSTEYDKAPWLGFRFTMPLNEARGKFQLPDDFEASNGGGKSVEFDHGQDKSNDKKPVEGVEIWYRAALYDQSVKHPDRLKRIVLVRGVEEPVFHADSPYQDVDPQTGRLTPQSMVGYPIHPLVTRSMADSAYVMSDCSVSRPQVNELNRFREQQIRMRDSNIPIRVYNPDNVPLETKQKLENAEYGSGFLPLPAEFFGGQDNIKEIAKATYPRENFVFEDKQDADIARTHAMDANQSGVQNETARTATELQLVQSNSNVRLDKERNKVLHWYVKGVTKFSTLVQRFVTEQQAAEVVGREKAAAWAQVMPMVPASLAFTAAPDSALRVDATQRRKIALETYAFLRNDPKVDSSLMLKEVVLPALGVDSRSIAQPQPPPPPQPEPPKASISIKGEDLIPFAPQYPGILLVLKASGLDVTQLPPPQAPPIVAPNPGVVQPDMGMETGGSQQGTGAIQGTGMKTPLGQPGGMITDAQQNAD